MRAFFILLSLCTLAKATTLAWDQDTDPSVTGYNLKYGNSSGAYPTKINVGKVLTYVLGGTPGTKYYAVVTAYNSSGTESLPSNEVSFTPPVPTPSPSPSVTPSPTSFPTPTPTATATPTPTATATPKPTATPTPSTKFKVGNKVSNTALNNVRSTPAGNLVGTQPAGAIATVVGGPTQATFNAAPVNWWQLTYAAAPNGWVGEDGLSLYTPPPTPQAPTNLHFTSPSPTP